MPEPYNVRALGIVLEAHAVLERQSMGDFPAVLQIGFDDDRTHLRGGIEVGLTEGGDVSNQQVGERVAGTGRIVCQGGDDALCLPLRRLNVAVILVVATGPECMVPPDLDHVVADAGHRLIGEVDAVVLPAGDVESTLLRHVH